MSVPDRANNPARQPELSINAHRGIFVPGDRHSSNSGLGMHWSANQNIAEDFASYTQNMESLKKRPDHPKDHAVIYNADIPISSIETDTKTLKNNNVLSVDNMRDNREDEVPVRRGAPVQLKSIVTAKGTRIRKRTYKTPREVRA